MTTGELIGALQEKLKPQEVNLAAYVERPKITLVAPGLDRPFPAKGFPRAELLTVNSRGESVWLYDAERLLKALNKQGIY